MAETGILDEEPRLKCFIEGDDGQRRAVEGKSVVVEVEPGVELIIRLKRYPSPAFGGQSLVALLAGPLKATRDPQLEHGMKQLILLPTAANVCYIHVGQSA